MLEHRISQVKDIRVAVIGVGYVGLPLAVKLAERGFSVMGLDINKDIIDQLQNGRSTVEGITETRLTKVVRYDRLLTLQLVDKSISKTSPQAIKSLIGVDVFIICVHTPLHPTKGWEPDTRWIRRSAKLIRRVFETELDSGQQKNERLVILESTTYPGTTRKIFSQIVSDFKAKGMTCHLAYSPERTSPGPNAYDDNAVPEPGKERSTFQITRIVGGLDESSKKAACALYKTIFKEIHPVDSLEAAEMIKLVENTFRFISIGFANEMARIARDFDLNIWQIIKAAKTKDFGLDLCFPGLIGGHCLPIDPHYLGWAVRNRRRAATFIEVAEMAHQIMKQDALELVRRLLSHHDRAISGSSILFFGIAYKKNVGDIRESAVLYLMKRLYSYGAKIYFWDPVFASHSVKRPLRLYLSKEECKELPAKVSEGLVQDEGNPIGDYYFEPEEMTGTWEDLRNQILGSKFGCIILATDHDEFHSAYTELISTGEDPPIADLCNAIESSMQKLPPSQTEELKKKLKIPGKYMLLGFH